MRCKLLSPPKGECFVTSDNPAILLNQFAAEKKSVRDYIGFAQTGFQLVLPLGPSLCAFLYDPFVYKVGNRKDELVEISAGDVEVLNSLQVQSAERCLYAHRVEEEPRVADLVRRYARHRRPDSATIKSFPQDKNQELVMFTNPPPVLPRRWQFCSRVKNIRSEVGDRRDPGYTHLIQLLMDDIEKNPTGVILEDRIKKIMGALPENAPSKSCDIRGSMESGCPNRAKIGKWEYDERLIPGLPPRIRRHRSPRNRAFITGKCSSGSASPRYSRGRRDDEKISDEHR